ncbi:MAG: hypothetical protein HN366_28440, partial [Deltaproteobacteria bacterium]|nr:hypothetical protein [Deltaproteobacteria bacterium]
MTTPLMLGGGSEYERSFAGRIDEVAWHNRALSAEEILAIYESNMRTWYWTLWRGRLQKGGVGLVALLALLYGVRYYSQRRAREADHRAREVADAANAAKSAFLANMSHEIRTPMNAILGYAQILRNHPALPPDQRRAVEAIYTSGDHLLELVNDVLDLSKIEAGHMDLQPVDFDLGQLVEGLAIMFQLRCQQKDLSWSLEQEGEDWQVH